MEGIAETLGNVPTKPFPLKPHYPMYQDQYTLSWSTRQRQGWSSKKTSERHIARPFKQLWLQLQQEGLSQVFGEDFSNNIKSFIKNIPSMRPGWTGPEIGFEFGFFEVRAGNARALRLTPPPGFAADFALSSEAGAATLASAVMGISVLAVEPILFPFFMLAAPAMVLPLIALKESARLLYSMCPGYPALYDIPVLDGMLCAHLPLMYGNESSDIRIQLWPPNGYWFGPKFFDIKEMVWPSYCTIALNLWEILKEEGALDCIERLPSNIENEDALTLINDLQDVSKNTSWLFEQVGDSLDNLKAAEVVGNTLDNLKAALEAGLRVVRPLPFGPYPERLYKPLPVIISEPRRSRSFLLVKETKYDRKNKKTKHDWKATTLYHPLTDMFNRTFEKGGVDALYASGSNPNGEAWKFDKSVIEKTFAVNPSEALVGRAESHERLDLSKGGSCSLYNWELFFHIPLLVAGRLARQQCFEEAFRWCCKVFDPTVSMGEAPQRFWRFKQFHEAYENGTPYSNQSSWLMGLASGTLDDDQTNILEAWRKDPFNLHTIARLRPGVYERSVVMRMIDILIQWADMRFRDGSWESINEASQLYFMARDILGPRPQFRPVRPTTALTFNQLESEEGVNSFGTAWAAIEEALPGLFADNEVANNDRLDMMFGPSLLYFGIPVNEKLLGYWNLIDDHLRKIRSCMDIEGRPRSRYPNHIGSESHSTNPSVFQPGYAEHPNVEELHRLPLHRFEIMLRKAYEVAGDVRSYGAALLGAIEKRDAEHLARPRASHEKSLLDAVRNVREMHIEEANHALEALQKGREAAKTRYSYYYYKSREFMNLAEGVKEALSIVATGLQFASGIQDLTAALMNAMPNITVGVGGHGNTPNVSASYGSTQIAGISSAAARALSLMASVAQGGGFHGGNFRQLPEAPGRMGSPG